MFEGDEYGVLGGGEFGAEGFDWWKDDEGSDLVRRYSIHERCSFMTNDCFSRYVQQIQLLTWFSR